MFLVVDYYCANFNGLTNVLKQRSFCQYDGRFWVCFLVLVELVVL